MFKKMVYDFLFLLNKENKGVKWTYNKNESEQIIFISIWQFIDSYSFTRINCHPQ